MRQTLFYLKKAKIYHKRKIYPRRTLLSPICIEVTTQIIGKMRYSNRWKKCWNAWLKMLEIEPGFIVFTCSKQVYYLLLSSLVISPKSKFFCYIDFFIILSTLITKILRCWYILIFFLFQGSQHSNFLMPGSRFSFTELFQ